MRCKGTTFITYNRYICLYNFLIILKCIFSGYKYLLGRGREGDFRKIKKAKQLYSYLTFVGATGFEPATTWSQTRYTTGLCYTPLQLLCFLIASAKVALYFEPPKLLETFFEKRWKKMKKPPFLGAFTLFFICFLFSFFYQNSISL